jgi:serine/threonine protein kinase
VSNVIPIHGRKRSGFAVGQLFVGRYRLLELLGRGGMGEVWAAQDEKIERVVALKLLHPYLLDGPGNLERFERESRALTRLEHHHVHVVPLYDWGTDPQPFIVMKKITGKTLREMLRAQGPIPWVAAVCFVIETAEGLWAIHRMKLWHRDVKPENIMVDEEGHVWILDFGIARDATEARPGGITERIGTLGYLPPEMILQQPTDHRGDLYQLGVVLYELLTGRKPYSGVDESKVTDMQAAHVHFAPDPIQPTAPDCPDELCAIVLRLLAKTPAQRYQSARDLWTDLSQVLRQYGSLPAGNALEPMIQRALVRRRLDSLSAPKREAPPKQAQKPSCEGQRKTLELAPGFIAKSPASPSTRPPAIDAERPTVDLPLGFVPVERAPFPLPPPIHTAVPAPIRTAVLTRAQVPPAREPFPLAKPRRPWWSAARAGSPTGLTLRLGSVVLVAAAIVLAARALWLRISVTPAAMESAAPTVASTSTENGAPTVAAAAPAASTPRAPSSTVAAVPPPSATAPAAPTKSAGPARVQPVRKLQRMIF